MPDPQIPKGVSADADNGFTGTTATQSGSTDQTAGTQQTAAASAAGVKKKKPTYDGPGLRTPARSGFVQQLTGVVNQGKNLMRSDSEESEEEGSTDDDDSRWALPTTHPDYPGRANPLQWMMEQNAAQQKKKKGLFGKILKRSDINARMGAWHNATQHPERASEFLKAVFGDDIDDEVSRQARYNEPNGTYDTASKKAKIFTDAVNTDPEYWETVWGITTESAPYEARDIALHAKNEIESGREPSDADELAKLKAERLLKKKKIAKSVLGSDEADAMAEEAAAEEGPDDFEAPGIKHMRDTKKERNDALKTLVDYTTMNKERVGQGAEIGAFLTGYDAAYNRDKLGDVTSMDVDVDTSSYLEALLDKGYITPEQYAVARKRFKEGRDAGLAGY